MQLLYADECLTRVQIDTATVKQFLLAQGMDEKKIDRLRIHIQHEPSARQRSIIVAQGDGDKAWGLLSGLRDVYVFINDRPAPMAPSLNRTLHHELRHFMKNGYLQGEIKLPYAQRPSEVDAYAFAAEQAPVVALVSIPGESPFSRGEDALIQILAGELVVCGLLLLRMLVRWLTQGGV